MIFHFVYISYIIRTHLLFYLNIIYGKSKMNTTHKETRGRRLPKAFIPALSALLTFIIYIIVCRSLQVFPFSREGPNTLVWADAFYQYLDFLGWFKDILTGKQSIWYTFSSSLGQNSAGIFSYYLASPFNLLLLFFPKTKIQVFFNIVIGLKMAACSCTMAVYLQERVRKLQPCFVLILSLCCGLMQYNFSQSSNLMWIDGVYMLPLILLGVYRLVDRGDTIFLSITVALSVLFCWYTGGINCLAAAMYYPVECCMKDYSKRKQSALLQFIHSSLLFIAAMLTGLAVSAFLFLPTVFAMRTGRGGTLDWALIRNELLGSPLSVISGYAPGEISSEGYAALYCGSLPLLGSLGYFSLRGRRVREKTAFLLLLFVSILSLYWRPLFMVFSLLKEAGSYWYRYSYVVEIFLIITSAQFLRDHKAIRRIPFAVTIVVCLVLAVLMDSSLPHENAALFRLGLGLAAAACILLTANTIRPHPAFLVLLLLLSSAELSISGSHVASHYLRDDALACQEYNGSQERLVNAVKKTEDGFYRITQNMTRSMDYHWTTANLNESMGFDYMAVENYTSCPQNTQMDMLDRFGYPVYSDRILPKSTFLQPVDSLLGVRYLLSPYEVRGVGKTGPSEPLNGKLVYRNDYALPLAFRSALPSGSFFLSDPESQSNADIQADQDSQFNQDSRADQDSRFNQDSRAYRDSQSDQDSRAGLHTDSGNDSDQSAAEKNAAAPFEYWNKVYCALSGSDREIMEELEYTRDKSDGEILYTINVPQGNYAVYGNITHRKDANAYLNLNDRFNIPYARWQAVQVFNIPSDADQQTVTVRYKAESLSRINDVKFYGLNLDTFRDLTDQLRESAPASLSLGKGKVSIDTQGSDGEILFTSIPYDDGWTIKRNGDKITPVLFENCLICIPLRDGENHIQMTYTAPGLRPGIVLSILGISALAAAAALKRHSFRSRGNR